MRRRRKRMMRTGRTRPRQRTRRRRMRKWRKRSLMITLEKRKKTREMTNVPKKPKKVSHGVSYSKLKAIFGKSINPNIMTIHGYCDEGYGIVHFTPKGGKSIEYDMCEKTNLESIRYLICNPPKGTIWRVLRYELPNPKKAQKQGRSHAPGFTTPSDDEGSAKVITTKNDKTNKGHGKKAVAKRKVKDGMAASKGVTTKAKTSEKVTTAKAVLEQVKPEAFYKDHKEVS